MGDRRESFAGEGSLDGDAEQCPRRAGLVIGEQVTLAGRERQHLIGDATVVGP